MIKTRNSVSKSVTELLQLNMLQWEIIVVTNTVGSPATVLFSTAILLCSLFMSSGCPSEVLSLALSSGGPSEALSLSSKWVFVQIVQSSHCAKSCMVCFWHAF